MTISLEGNQHSAWGLRAIDLARWAAAHLVNRTDVWGGYHAIADRDKVITLDDGTSTKLGASTTRPAKKHRGQLTLTPSILERHFRAGVPEHLVGLHSTSASNTSRWGAIDIDQHGDSGLGPAANVAAATAWYERLRGLGFQPLLTDSNGKGGFHLLAIFACPVATARVFGFMRWLTCDFAALGLPQAVETFPKQPKIEPGRYGNWLRLSGRHHTRSHWSRAWDGTTWLEGSAAIDLILALSGDSPHLIPAEAIVTAPPPARPWVSPPRTARSNTIERYLAKLPTGLAEGQQRDCHAFRFACFLVRDLGLSDAEALPWLMRWDAQQMVGKGEKRLAEIVANARRYGRRPIGSGQRDSRRTDQPVIRSTGRLG